MAATSTTALVALQPAFTDAERLTLAGFLAGYRGLTRDAYALDLRQFTTWCRARSLNLFAARRADIESFARDLEARGRARATVTRRLYTIAGFYRYAVEEELLEPATLGLRLPAVLGERHRISVNETKTESGSGAPWRCGAARAGSARLREYLARQRAEQEVLRG